jgi:hypothetical protein
MIFRLYDAAAAGNEIVRDRHTTLDSSPVNVSGGLFNVLIGSGSVQDGSGPGSFADLSAAFHAHSSVYLEVQVEFETLNPRTRIASAPYALGGPRGVTYTRWGRNSCPAGSTLVYAGYPVSSGYQTAGTSSQLCLAPDPTWDEFSDANNNVGDLLGTEFVGVGGVPSFVALLNQDPYCAVCLQPDADTTFMYPGRQSCPEGWKTEYFGYLVSNASLNSAARDALCVDRNPDLIPGGSGNDDGNLWYTVEAICGSLPCPPYVNQREITCAVCSR